MPYYRIKKAKRKQRAVYKVSPAESPGHPMVEGDVPSLPPVESRQRLLSRHLWLVPLMFLTVLFTLEFLSSKGWIPPIVGQVIRNYAEAL